MRYFVYMKTDVAQQENKEENAFQNSYDLGNYLMLTSNFLWHILHSGSSNFPL